MRWSVVAAIFYVSSRFLLETICEKKGKSFLFGAIEKGKLSEWADVFRVLFCCETVDKSFFLLIRVLCRIESFSMLVSSCALRNNIGGSVIKLCSENQILNISGLLHY